MELDTSGLTERTSSDVKCSSKCEYPEIPLDVKERSSDELISVTEELNVAIPYSTKIINRAFEDGICSKNSCSLEQIERDVDVQVSRETGTDTVVLLLI